MQCQSKLFLYGANNQIFIPGCGDKPKNYQPASGIPVKESWYKLGCAIVQAVSIEQGDYQSTPLGSASQRLIVSLQNNREFAQINYKQLLFATLSKGFAWDETSGAVDDILRLGNMWRLIINPANLAGAGKLCNQ
jgi:hypothetical protein